MSDPKKDLLRKSGPLGLDSTVTPEIAQKSTDPQAMIMYQNDEQLKAVYRLEGAVHEGFSGLKDWVSKLEARLVIVEDFRKSVLVLPKAIWALAGVIGFDGLMKAYHLIFP